ncbi:penicillin-binding protein 2, partial [Rhizobium viscosum]
MSIISRILKIKSRSHILVARQRIGIDDKIPGTRKKRSGQTRQRLGVLIGAFVCGFLLIGGRLIQYGLAEEPTTASLGNPNVVASRPDIIDRNGQLLATDLNMVSLYADPRRIVDADEVVEKLAAVIPNLDWRETHKKLRMDSGFQWLRRQLTPRQQADI